MTANNDSQWQRLGLSRNPFPPATTGSAFVDDLVLPESWERALRERIAQLASSDGPKALLIEGGYGSGKTLSSTGYSRRYFTSTGSSRTSSRIPGWLSMT